MNSYVKRIALPRPRRNVGLQQVGFLREIFLVKLKQLLRLFERGRFVLEGHDVIAVLNFDSEDAAAAHAITRL